MPDQAPPIAACRIDVWLWRARLFKNRAQSAAWVQSGRIRQTRDGATRRPDKPSKSVKVGDELVFAIGGRLVAVRVEQLGWRRGPSAEARALYRPLETTADAPPPAIDNEARGLKNTAAAPGPPAPHPPEVAR